MGWWEREWEAKKAIVETKGVLGEEDVEVKKLVTGCVRKRSEKQTEEEGAEDARWGEARALKAPRQLSFHSVLDSQIKIDEAYLSYLPS